MVVLSTSNLPGIARWEKTREKMRAIDLHEGTGRLPSIDPIIEE